MNIISELLFWAITIALLFFFWPLALLSAAFIIFLHIAGKPKKK